MFTAWNNVYQETASGDNLQRLRRSSCPVRAHSESFISPSSQSIYSSTQALSQIRQIDSLTLHNASETFGQENALLNDTSLNPVVHILRHPHVPHRKLRRPSLLPTAQGDVINFVGENIQDQNNLARLENFHYHPDSINPVNRTRNFPQTSQYLCCLPRSPLTPEENSSESTFYLQLDSGSTTRQRRPRNSRSVSKNPGCWTRVKRALNSAICLKNSSRYSKCFFWPQKRIHNENLFVMSLIQLLCGFAAVILSGVAYSKGVFLHKMATGLWAGFIMLVTGSHGIIASVKSHVCTLISLLIFCIFACLASTLLACVSIAGLIEDGFMLNSIDTLNYQTLSLDHAGSEIKHPSLFIDNQSSSRIRLHQVILHILLLVVGLLEASVAVSSAVICCRHVCPSYTGRYGFVNFSSTNYPYPYGRTRQNQDNFLALQANVEEYAHLQQQMQVNGPPTRALSPTLHPTAQSFLPETARRALILTHAEPGPLAVSAAQATAVCLGQLAASTQTQVNTPIEPTRSAPIRPTSLCLEDDCSIAPRISMPQYLTHTMNYLKKLKNRRRCCNEDQEDIRDGISPITQMASTSVNQLLSSPQRSSYVYFMPSPTPGEPPIIFPPFPPPYSITEAGYNSGSPQQPIVTTSTETFPSNSVARANSLLSTFYNQRPLQNIPRFERSHRNPSTLTNRTSSTNRSLLNSQARSRANLPFMYASSSVLMTGDRILQPVLIIQEEEPVPDYFNNEETIIQIPCTTISESTCPPPAYSSRPNTPASSVVNKPQEMQN